MYNLSLMDFDSFVEKVGHFIGTFAKIIMICIAALIVYRVVNYFLRSAALARIGRRRHIKAWGLAWVPVLYLYVFGAIADDHDKKNTGCKTGLGVFLPLTFIFSWLCRKGAKWISGARLKDTARAAKQGIEAVRTYLATLNKEVFPICFTLTVLWLVLRLIYVIYRYVCAYKIVESCRPKRALWVMLIYALIPFAKPFVLLFVSGGDAHPVIAAAAPAAGEPAPVEEGTAPDTAVSAEEVITVEEVSGEKNAPEAEGTALDTDAVEEKTAESVPGVTDAIEAAGDGLAEAAAETPAAVDER